MVVGEYLQVFEQKDQEWGVETKANYEFWMKDLISHIFPPKALQRQKRYLRRGVYKSCDTNIRYFICHIDKMVNYLGKFPPFGAVQSLSEDEILDLVEFSLSNEWQKELIIQGFDSATQGLTNIVEFCKHLENAE